MWLRDGEKWTLISWWAFSSHLLFTFSPCYDFLFKFFHWPCASWTSRCVSVLGFVNACTCVCMRVHNLVCTVFLGFSLSVYLMVSLFCYFFRPPSTCVAIPAPHLRAFCQHTFKISSTRHSNTLRNLVFILEEYRACISLSLFFLMI